MMIRNARWRKGGGEVAGNMISNRAKSEFKPCWDVCGEGVELASALESHFMFCWEDTIPRRNEGILHCATRGLDGLTFDQASNSIGNQVPLYRMTQNTMVTRNGYVTIVV